jgi:hypothetical protein
MGEGMNRGRLRAYRRAPHAAAAAAKTANRTGRASTPRACAGGWAAPSWVAAAPAQDTKGKGGGREKQAVGGGGGKNGGWAAGHLAGPRREGGEKEGGGSGGPRHEGPKKPGLHLGLKGQQEMGGGFEVFPIFHLAPNS